MKKNTNNTKNEVQYNFYKEQLKKAENPYTVYASFAIGIAKCKEYTKAKKGQALEVLTRAWIDIYETI